MQQAATACTNLATFLFKQILEILINISVLLFIIPVSPIC